MNRILTAAAIFLVAGGAATAQESSLGSVLAADLQRNAELELPAFESPTDPSLMRAATSPLLVGVHVGFQKMADADDANQFVGIHTGFALGEEFSLEVALQYHTSTEFASGDAEITMTPLLITARYHLRVNIPSATTYLAGGVGFYPTQIEYSGLLAAASDDNTSEFGFHLGAGIQVTAGSNYRVNVDLRYILMRPNFSDLEDDNLDMVQFALGFSFQL